MNHLEKEVRQLSTFESKTNQRKSELIKKTGSQTQRITQQDQKITEQTQQITEQTQQITEQTLKIQKINRTSRISNKKAFWILKREN